MNQHPHARRLLRRRPALWLAWPALIVAVGLAHSPAAEPAGKSPEPPAETLPGTRLLTGDADMCVETINHADHFLDRALERSIAGRAKHWQRDLSSPEAYAASVEPNRQRFAAIVGVRDPRVAPPIVEFLTSTTTPGPVGSGLGYTVWSIRWSALDGLSGEGLLLEPTAQEPLACVVVVPDCAQTPEMTVGLTAGIAEKSQLARRLAENGCRVIVPALIDRMRQFSAIAHGTKKGDITHRELLNRAAYQMGRTVVGLELQTILAAIDWFAARSPASGSTQRRPPLAVVGYGEGGLLALYAGALDTRIETVGVSGYFDSRQNVWREPIDHNFFGLLEEFGDAEIASLIAPRPLLVEASGIATFEIPPGSKTAPGRVETPSLASVRGEFARLGEMIRGLTTSAPPELIVSGNGDGPPASEPFVAGLLGRLGTASVRSSGPAPTKQAELVDPTVRLKRQIDEMALFNERLIDDGPQIRDEFMSKINTKGTLEDYVESVKPYRQYFAQKVIGQFDDELTSPNVRSRLKYDTPDFRGYEIVLDVYPEVIFYGILLIPTNLKPGERRPVVVCQHGHDGRAEFTIEGNMQSYQNFSARLAQRGFVVFAPQHLYRGGDPFRTVQRKANPLGKSIFSLMVAQHRQLLAWLGSLDFVDPARIGFYGISYGGKSAMRIPAILEGYCLSICSSDFSDWIWRTVSNRHAGGYMLAGEYEIFEFNLGNTFNYAEMATMICPRPFMDEELGHRGDIFSKLSASQWGQVELLYELVRVEDRLGLSFFPSKPTPDECAHRKTFDFLEKHLARAPGK